MKLANDVTNLLLQIENTDQDICSHELESALQDAERMADQFENIKPTPYIVPIERAVGAYRLNQTETLPPMTKPITDKHLNEIETDFESLQRQIATLKSRPKNRRGPYVITDEDMNGGSRTD